MRKLLFILPVLFFLGCKKDDFVKESFSGIVLHTVTKQPLANQEVLLFIENIKYGEKDLEFPNGRPIYTKSEYTTRTNNTGHYSFTDINVTSNWHFVVQLKTAEYIQNFLVNTNTGASGPFYPVPSGPRKTGDTLYAERPGYIRYQIKNINTTFDNDTLYLYPTFNSRQRKLPSEPMFFKSDNRTFIGKTIDVSRTDTLPAEFLSLIPIQWLHRRSDTIVFKSENITISPNTTTDYTIHY